MFSGIFLHGWIREQQTWWRTKNSNHKILFEKCDSVIEDRDLSNALWADWELRIKLVGLWTFAVATSSSGNSKDFTFAFFNDLSQKLVRSLSFFSWSEITKIRPHQITEVIFPYHREYTYWSALSFDMCIFLNVGGWSTWKKKKN